MTAMIQEANEHAPQLDNDQDGVLDAHEDRGQAGDDPDEGPRAPLPTLDPEENERTQQP